MSAVAASPAPVVGWTVLCDFDGTIAPDDVTDSLLVRFAGPGWEELEMRWREGSIGSRECMAGQVALLDCSREELGRHLEGVQIDPQFKAFVAAVRAAGVRLRIVSDGLDLAIHTILNRNGIVGVEIFASRLVMTGPRSWTLDFPYARSNCISASATCKCALAEKPKAWPTGTASSPAVLMIGDGLSDVCVAGRADLTLARKQLLAHCVERGYRHRAVDDFGQALEAWKELSMHAAAADDAAHVEEALHARC